jgi:hypothetical protein
MSLILDALKKLEREKGAGDSGVVVVGTVPWGEAGARRHRGRLAAAAVLVLLLVALGAWWMTGRKPAAVEPATATETTKPAAPAPRTLGDDPVPAQVVRPPASASALPAPQPAATPLVPPTPRLGEPPGSLAGRPATETAAGAPTEPAAQAAPSEHVPEPGPARTAGHPAVPELRLTAISARDGQPVAIVNDRLVREGDSFDGVRVVRIGEAEVEVEIRGRRHVLRF